MPRYFRPIFYSLNRAIRNVPRIYSKTQKKTKLRTVKLYFDHFVYITAHYDVVFCYENGIYEPVCIPGIQHCIVPAAWLQRVMYFAKSSDGRIFAVHRSSQSATFNLH